MSRRYAIFEETGEFRHLLIAGMHAIPTKAIPVTAQQARDLASFTDGVWKLVDGKIVNVPHDPPAKLTLEELRQAKIDAATEKRWEVETGGLILSSGARVDTTTASQNRITTVIENAERAGIEVVDFKALSGWVTLTIAELKLISIDIARLVQACFSAERAHHEAISALETAEEIEAYDVGQGWPSNDLRPPEEPEEPDPELDPEPETNPEPETP